MPLAALAGEKSRLGALLEHFSVIEAPREPWKVAHPLPEALLLVVCGMIADCDGYDRSCGRCNPITTTFPVAAGSRCS